LLALCNTNYQWSNPVRADGGCQCLSCTQSVRRC